MRYNIHWFTWKDDLDGIELHDCLKEAPETDSFRNSHSQWDTFGFTLQNMGFTPIGVLHKILRLEVNILLSQELLEAHIEPKCHTYLAWKN